MNNITNKTKTILFASLIAALILPLSSIDFADAEVKQYADKIPEDKLISRSDEWKLKYDSIEDYETSESEITAYVTDKHPDNKWNKAMVKEHIKIRNFETIIGERGVGLEIVALSVQQQKLQDRYTESQPVQKYHDWLLTKYSVPDNEQAIDKRLLDIIGDKKFDKITKELVKSYNNMAEHGTVPLELYEQNPTYWNQVISIALCDYEPSCDADVRRANLGNDVPVTKEQWDAFRQFESTNGINPETGESYECIFIQCAHAAGWVLIHLSHTVFASIQPSACDDGTGLTCEVVSSWFGTGSKTVQATGGSNHARSNTAVIKAYSDTTDNAGVNEVKATVTLAGANQVYGPVVAFDKAQIWQWVTQGTCGGGSQCGTYTNSVFSPDAYKWVFQ